MKNITIYYSCVTVLLSVLFFMSCEGRKQLSLFELASIANFQADFPDTFTSLPIGIYAANDDLSASCSNLKYENKEGMYSLSDSGKVCHRVLKNQNVSVYAYAPYRKDIKSDLEKHRILVYSDQSDSTNYVNSDFLYAMVDHKDLSADSIKLSFKNKLAKLIINVKKVNPSNPNNISFEITNVATSTNINLRAGILFDPEDIGSIKPLKKKRADSGFDYTLEAILVPQNISGNTAIFTFKIDGKDYCYRTKYDTSLESSMQYIYNITVDKNGLSVESEELPRIKGSISDNIVSVSERVYKIGDYYPIADDPLSAIGVVFSVMDNGAHGKILSLNEAIDLEWGPPVSTGAKSKISGAGNRVIVEKQAHSKSGYRALSWCLSKGKDWYLPAINELAAIYKQKEVLNRALSPLLRSNSLGNGVYVSSTEDSGSKVLVLHFGNGQRFLQDKSLNFHVRAVCDF